VVAAPFVLLAIQKRRPAQQHSMHDGCAIRRQWEGQRINTRGDLTTGINVYCPLPLPEHVPFIESGDCPSV
jgi:hypothetical protein